MDERSFLQCRARIQRLSDAKMLVGWVSFLKGMEIQVKTADDIVQSGQRLALEVNGRDGLGRAEGVVLQSSPGHIFMRLDQPMKVAKAKEAARSRVTNVRGILAQNGNQLRISVIDVSADGAAIACPEKLAISSRVSFRFESVIGNVCGRATVVYCRRDKSDDDLFRVGIAIESLDPADRRLWSTLTTKAQKAA